MRTEMRGRAIYARLRRPLAALVSMVSYLPRGVQRRLVNYRTVSDGFLARAVRFSALKAISVDCGELVDIRSLCRILSPEGMHIGSRVSIHPYTYIDAAGGIRIGDDVSIAHAVTILSTTHTWTDPHVPIREQPVTRKPTEVGNDVWIGAGARLLAGVKIGAGAIVGSGAVVTRDVPAGSIVGGVPARELRGRQ